MVLVLEDDADDFFFLQRALGRAGVTLPLFHLENGAAAVSYFRGEGEFADRKRFPIPIVVIADLKMPAFDGLEFVRWLRQKSDHKSVPVIVISSSTIASDVSEAYASGANWFIEKPLDPTRYDAFAAALRDWLTIISLPAAR